MEKTNMVTQVTNNNAGGYWFKKPMLAGGATVLAAVSLVGCSNGNAAPIAAGSNNNASGGTGVSQAASPSDDRHNQICYHLVAEITSFQADIIRHGQDRYSEPGFQSDLKEEPVHSIADGDLASFHDPEASAIAIAAVPDPHSKEIHRRVKEYCGSYFDTAVKREDNYEVKHNRPEPDWSL